MFWVIVFSIILLGLLFVIAEILFVPGGILGVLGILVVLFGLYYGYANGSKMDGHIVLAVTIISTILLIVIAIRTKTWDKISLKSQMDQKYNVNIDIQVKKGDEGLSITRLNPAGKARFANEDYEVSSLSGFVDQNQKIIIHKIEGSKIYIKLKT